MMVRKIEIVGYDEGTDQFSVKLEDGQVLRADAGAVAAVTGFYGEPAEFQGKTFEIEV